MGRGFFLVNLIPTQQAKGNCVFETLKSVSPNLVSATPRNRCI